jgi:Holliday junction DNA helicase RuvA
MAERIILELKDKALKLRKDEGGAAVIKAAAPSEELIKEDALSALINLGYKSHQAREALEKTMKQYPEDVTVEGLLKRTLNALSGM